MGLLPIPAPVKRQTIQLVPVTPCTTLGRMAPITPYPPECRPASKKTFYKTHTFLGAIPKKNS